MLLEIHRRETDLGADVDDGAVGSWEDSGVAGLPRAPLGTVVVLPEGALRKGKG